jgi:hypothetical protein
MSVYKNDTLANFKECIESLKLDKNDMTLYLSVDGKVAHDLNSYITELNKGNFIRVYKFNKSIGLTKRRNFLISESLLCSQHKYFFRMDADDISINNRFKVQSDFLDTRTDVDIVASHSRDVWPSGRVYTRNLPTDHSDIVMALCRRNPVKHSTVCLRRSILENNKYNEYYDKVQDRVFWVDIILNGGVFEILPQNLIEYRHGNNLISRRKSFQTIKFGFFAQFYAIYKLQPFSVISYVHLFFTLIYKVLPTPIVGYIYRKLEK